MNASTIRHFITNKKNVFVRNVLPLGCKVIASTSSSPAQPSVRCISSSALVTKVNNDDTSSSILLTNHWNSNKFHIGVTKMNHQRFTSFSTTSEATDKLVDLLSREHAEEIENEGQVMPTDLKELKTKLEKEWKIIDSEENAITRMYKTIGSTKVQVSFHCQDTVTADTVPDDDQQPVDTNDEYGEPADPVKFTVTITKSGKSIIFTCLSEDAIVKIQSCAISNEDVDTIVNEGGSVPVINYQGPEFIELAEDLQDAFHIYLEETIGLTTDMAAFISMYTDYKEQTQYIKFLNNVKSIVS